MKIGIEKFSLKPFIIISFTHQFEDIMTPKQKHAQKLRSNWEEVILSNLLKDAPRMTMAQIASRYRVSAQTILNYLNKYGLRCKTSFTCSEVHKKMEKSVSTLNSSVVIDCANIRPKHQHFQIAV